MFFLKGKIVLFSAMAIFVSTSVVNAQKLLTDEQLKSAYEKAVKTYEEDYTSKSQKLVKQPENVVSKSNNEEAVLQEEQNVVMAVDNVTEFSGLNNGADLIPLGSVNIAVNVENKSLKDIVKGIVKKAEKEAGHWDVKWRLRPENEHVLEARVNLTAETNFESFMDHLLDRVNNMTGIQLGVSVFEMSRIIIISDTY